ncbi:MAG: M3 family metallopeptidase, partial [Pseudomonadota bacterium]|nr:M3 family metallopeptidase [Pseudomonadota bacterium]
MSTTLAVLTVAGAAAAAAPVLPGPAFPAYASASALVAACDSGLSEAKARVAALEKRRIDGHWLAAYDALNAYVEDGSGPLSLLENVHPDKPIRDAAQACGLRWADFGSTLGQNEVLYRAARSLKPTSAIDREFRKQLLEGFEDAGVALPADKRARAKQVNDRIVDLGQQFDARIRDAGIKVAFAADELAGVADTVWKDKPRDDQGRYLLGLDYPTYLPVLERADRAATRERMWRAKQNEGGDANLKLLGELGQLRREYAQLFGLKSFAEFQLRRRMTESPAHTQAFLSSVKAAVTERETRDIDELRAAKAAQLGTPLASTRLDRWDISYYTERVRKQRYSIDQEAFRPYFPPQESLRFVMRIAEKMLGVRYTRIDNAPGLWHPDVQAYAISDARSGKPLSTLYVDLYPREGKYNHAAVWGIRGGS